jgi:hypothetical protein
MAVEGDKETMGYDAIIKWSNAIRYSEIEDSTNNGLDTKRGFYMVLTGKWNAAKAKYEGVKPQYIGMTYDQDSIRERVLQPHKPAYDIIDGYLKKLETGYEKIVKVGIIIIKEQERISAELVSDIEKCLIYSNRLKLPANDKNKSSYTGGRDIAIKNIGNSHIEEESRQKCQNSDN